MFKDLFRDVEEEVSKLSKQEAIRYLTNEINYYVNEYNKYNELLFNAERSPTNFIEAAKKIKEKANQLLVAEAERALETSNEYNHPFFASRLISACNKLEAINIVVDELAGTFEVNIDLDTAAGSIEDYAKGVKAYRRRVLHTTKNNPEKASRDWRLNYYMVAREGRQLKRKTKEGKEEPNENLMTRNIKKYWDTMEGRIIFSGKLAPFWKLLDKGTIPLKSDYGGTGYPQNNPTNFVFSAQLAIEVEFNSILQNESKTNVQIKEIEEAVKDLRDLLQKLRELKNKLNNLVPKAIEVIQRYLEETRDTLEFSNYDPIAVRKAAESYINTGRVSPEGYEKVRLGSSKLRPRASALEYELFEALGF